MLQHLYIKPCADSQVHISTAMLVHMLLHSIRRTLAGGIDMGNIVCQWSCSRRCQIIIKYQKQQDTLVYECIALVTWASNTC